MIVSGGIGDAEPERDDVEEWDFGQDDRLPAEIRSEIENRLVKSGVEGPADRRVVKRSFRAYNASCYLVSGTVIVNFEYRNRHSGGNNPARDIDDMDRKTGN